MKLIVGLGNPGTEYKDTRHNVGFMIVDKLARELSVHAAVWKREEKFKAEVVKIDDTLLVKPITFVNQSGLAVALLVNFFKLKPDDVWVIHDDMDLPIGKLRIRTSGASAGHNGVESIIKHLKSDKFVRFRLGIGRGKDDFKKHTDRQLHHRSVIAFVLSRFGQSEAGDMRKLIKNGVEAIRIALDDGIPKAMNRFN